MNALLDLRFLKHFIYSKGNRFLPICRSNLSPAATLPILKAEL